MKSYYTPKGLPKKKCLICNKIFQCTGKNQKCCLERNCFLEHKRRYSKFKYLKEKPKIEKICFLCKKPFLINQERRKFCSKECSTFSRKTTKYTRKQRIYSKKPKIYFKCEFCKKETIKKFKHQKFCSKSCGRKPTTERRFRILLRDNFTCQYCGQKAPNVILHVDHILPASKGGTCEDLNLITACLECNLGKSNTII